MKKYVVILLLGAVGCHGRQPVVRSARPSDSAVAARRGLKSLHFDYGKDPTCGMPLKYGLEDTLHYKGKLYGFCSKECKEEFLKDPVSYLAKAK